MGARAELALHVGEMRIELLRDARFERLRRGAETRGVEAQQDRRHRRTFGEMQPFEMADMIVGAARGHEITAAVALAQIFDDRARFDDRAARSEEHTSEPQSLMRISYCVFCLEKKKIT